MQIKVIHRRGSSYGRQIRMALGNHRIGECQGAINFGLQGSDLQDYLNRWQCIQHLPMINARQHGNKYECVRDASAAGVPAPWSATSTAGLYEDRSYIIKPFYSLGGRDIHRFEGNLPGSHYIQEEITNRRYEMRVHCWKWIDPQRWIFQKRVHPDGNEQLTWNFHTGGSFITINEPFDPLHDRIRTSVQTLMNVFNYQFGAVDFIIANAGQRGGQLPHYFIEWNLAPGWTLEHVRDAYINNFQALEDLDPPEFRQLLADETPIVVERQRPQQRTEQLVEEASIPEQNQASERRSAADREREQMQRAWQAAIEQRERELQQEQQAENRNVEVNFCPSCGSRVNNNIFGIIPRFCPSCGQRVRQ